VVIHCPIGLTIKADEGTENIDGSELSIVGSHSHAISSSGLATNQADSKCINKISN
jgi:hypothetical protein